MLFAYIKYFSLILCSYYIYLKLLHTYIEKDTNYRCIVSLFFLSAFTCILRLIALPFSIFITVIVFSFILHKFTIISPKLSIITSIISFGISYTFFIFSAFITLYIHDIISLLLNGYSLELFSTLTIEIIQFFLTFITFRLKRLRKGMPFLKEHGKNYTVVYVSLLILLTITSVSLSEQAALIYIIPISVAFFAGLSILFWWRSHLTQTYINKIRHQEIIELQRIIYEKDKEIERVQLDNQKLASIIHKDNKLLPAMEYAVKEVLLLTSLSPNSGYLKEKGGNLLHEISILAKERTGIISNYEMNGKNLPSTNIPSIDILLNYMLNKSHKEQIDLDLSQFVNVNYFINNLIEEVDLKTLLADLIENAIIATKKCCVKKILISFASTDKIYSISFWDTGEHFKPETVLKLGINQTTTYKNEGGSGIGMMTTFKILKKYDASLVITEFSPENSYSKKVSIHFDSLNQFRLKTLRPEIISLAFKRKDIILDEIK